MSRRVSPSQVFPERPLMTNMVLTPLQVGWRWQAGGWCAAGARCAPIYLIGRRRQEGSRVNPDSGHGASKIADANRWVGFDNCHRVLVDWKFFVNLSCDFLVQEV